MRRTGVERVLLVLALCVTFSCGKKNSTGAGNDNLAPIIASLTADPNELDLNGTSRIVVIAVDPEEMNLTFSWSASGGAFLTSAANDTVDWQAPATSGNYTCTVTVSDGDHSVNRSVTIVVAEHPRLRVDADSLLFGGAAQALLFNISNPGTGVLDWTIGTTTTDGGNWISANPAQGTTSTETDPVTVTVDRSGFSSGSYSGRILISSNGGSDTVDVTARKESPIHTGRWVGTNEIRFGVVNQTRIDTFSITFRGLGFCSMVKVKTYPVSISDRKFSVNYNIPSISSGSVSGSFSEDGNSASGTFSYTNISCSGSKSGTWTAGPAQSGSIRTEAEGDMETEALPEIIGRSGQKHRIIIGKDRAADNEYP